MIDLASPYTAGATAIAAGQADASRTNQAIAQQAYQYQQENQLHQQQQQFEQQRQIAEFNLQRQQAQETAKQNWAHLQYLQSSQQDSQAFKDKALGAQNARAGNALQTRQGIADSMLQFKYDHDTMRDDQFQQTYGLRKDQVMSSIAYHDAKIRQGDTSIQNLDNWRQSQLDQGADRIATEKAYHAAVLQMQQAEEQGRNARGGASQADIATRQNIEAQNRANRDQWNANSNELKGLVKYNQSDHPENLARIQTLKAWLQANPQPKIIPIPAPRPVTPPVAAPTAPAFPQMDYQNPHPVPVAPPAAPAATPPVPPAPPPTANTGGMKKATPQAEQAAMDAYKNIPNPILAEINILDTLKRQGFTHTRWGVPLDQIRAKDVAALQGQQGQQQGQANALPPPQAPGTLIRQKSTGKLFKSTGQGWQEVPAQ